jgi:hypothetical protein
MGYYSQQLQVTIAIAISVLMVSTIFRFTSIHFQRHQMGTIGFWFINTIGSLSIIFAFTLVTIGVRNHETRQVVWMPFAGVRFPRRSRHPLSQSLGTAERMSLWHQPEGSSPWSSGSRRRIA